MKIIKKLFGGIDLSWKKLIIFALVVAIYTAAMAIIPITTGTSFNDIAATLEWWILFGIIIICNSKSPKDSALKCFVFFLISQPLIYLFQVPFSWQGWGLFDYYKYWFIITLFTLPMGYIGYYIKKDNILSVFILLPMLVLLSITGLNFFKELSEQFPYHLLSFIACYVFIIIIILGVLNKPKLKVLSFVLVIISTVIYLFMIGGLEDEYDAYKSLEEYSISGNVVVSSFSGTKKGNVEVRYNGEWYILKLNGKKNGYYKFTISDDTNEEKSFEYYYDENSKSVVINEAK